MRCVASLEAGETTRATDDFLSFSQPVERGIDLLEVDVAQL
jgi:hypothetical protein